MDFAIVGFALFAAVSIIWFSLRTGISPMPSAPLASRAMLAAAAKAPAGPVIDLGSGWGTVAILFARRYPERVVVGYELSWIPWLVSSLFKHLLGLQNLSFRRADFLDAELRTAAVLVCYLFPRGMQQLSGKLRQEGYTGVLISNTFALPSFEPDELIRLSDFYRTPIYTYRSPAP